MSTARTVEELKNLTDPLRVYEEYVRLTHRGKRAKGLCPFHREKTPSFSVDSETGLFYCFGCHKGGDLLQFIQEVEGCAFREALEILARKAGVALEMRSTGPAEAPDRRERLRKVLAASQEFYRKALVEAPDSGAVRSYLKRRGISSRTEAALGLGYAHPGGGLQPHLLRAGFKADELQEAGLLLERPGGEGAERFRNRLLFPILDAMGRPVGFGGRSLGDDEPKYLNSPESPVFQKRDLLYGLSWTKNSIRERSQAILVEGYMDFLALYQAGFSHVVATLGTALSEGQVKLLKRYASEIILNFDRDAAGLAAAKRAVQLLLAQSVRVKVLQLPSGKDPDEFLRANGAEAYGESLQEATPFFTFLAEQSEAGTVLHTVEGDLKVLQELAEYLRAIPDPLEREAYARDLASRLRMDPKKIMRRLGEDATVRRPAAAAQAEPHSADVPRNQQILVCGLLQFPEARAEVASMVPVEALPALAAGPLLRSLLQGLGAEGPEQTVLLAYIRHSCHEAPTQQDTLSAARSILQELCTEKERKIQQQIREASRKNDLGLIQILNREKMAVVRQRQLLAEGR